MAMIGNIYFSFFVIGVLVFTIMAATYEPEDPLFLWKKIQRRKKIQIKKMRDLIF